MSTNMNQYGFLELNNSRIMINKEMLSRLIELSKKQLIVKESKCAFFMEKNYQEIMLFLLI